MHKGIYDREGHYFKFPGPTGIQYSGLITIVAGAAQQVFGPSPKRWAFIISPSTASGFIGFAFGSNAPGGIFGGNFWINQIGTSLQPIVLTHDQLGGIIHEPLWLNDNGIGSQITVASVEMLLGSCPMCYP